MIRSFSLCLSLCLLAVAGSARDKRVQKVKNPAALKTTKMKVEIWSDVMCPFCYIGKRKFEAAVAEFADTSELTVEWKSFQLDPGIKAGAEKDLYSYLANRKGISYEQARQMHEQVVAMAASVGLEYDFEKAVVANSFDAHRLIQLAKQKGLGDAAEEQLFRAYFTEGKDFGDHGVLLQLAQEIGLDPQEIKTLLDSDQLADRVKADVAEAEQIGVNGVPFFVFDRKYAISGAQDTKVFLQTLQRSFAEWQQENKNRPLQVQEGASCTPGGDCK
jgi:predicted DsbA family dithiol-disulfide isomerase